MRIKDPGKQVKLERKKITDHLPDAPGTEKAQSLVEFAIILPLLLIMLLGVFEVGWALRGYLTLTNVNREATRFAARGIYLDFDQIDCGTDCGAETEVGYDRVVSHTLRSLSSQLALNLTSVTPTGSEIITYYNLEPDGFNCLGDADCQPFDCSRFAYENRGEADFVAGDGLQSIDYPILIEPADYAGHADLPAYYNKVLTLTNSTAISAYHHHEGSADFSQIDPEEMVFKLRSQMNQQTCELVQKGIPPTNSGFVVVENVFYQNQLVGLPFVTAFIPDPIPFYSHTVMRVTENLRETTEDGETPCELFPIGIPMSKVSGVYQGDEIVMDWSNSPNVPGNFGWLHWKSDTNSCTSGNQEYCIPDNLANPGNAATDYVEPDSDPADTQVNINDWIQVRTGSSNGDAVKDEMNILAAQEKEMRMPVWYDGDCGPGGTCVGAEFGGSNGKYRILTFVVLKLVETDFPHDITFEFSHFDPYVCQGDDQG